MVTMPTAEGVPDARWTRSIRRRLLAWFRRHARDLPWRRTRDPYCVWVSEIMLQQTQVATVIHYYQRFLQGWPTVGDLARADEQQVLRLWEGLGYYSRARQLQQAAQRVMAEHGGVIPRDLASLRALPGIGRYTAGAIASIAWDVRAPILEANSTRVLARWLAYAGDPSRAAGQRRLWSLAEHLLPRHQVGLFNQALMELGSEICTPRTPGCRQCPVSSLCPTQARGWQSRIPRVARRPRYEDVYEMAVVVRRGTQVLLRQCGPEERWAGLWDFIRFPVNRESLSHTDEELASRVQELTGLHVSIGRRLARIKHGVTRFRITLLCHEARVLAGRLRRPGLRWIPASELPDYPLSVTGRKISRLL